MNIMKKLPIGIEYFEERRRDDFYYVDKTGMIKELLENKAKLDRHQLTLSEHFFRGQREACSGRQGKASVTF